MKPLRFLLPLFAMLVATAPVTASADSAPWHVYNLTASGRTLSSPQAAGQNTDVATFDFLSTPTTSYLLNHQLGGDIREKTIKATFSITGSGTLDYNMTDNVSGYSPTVRIFFETSSTGGFNQSNFWWSHPGATNISAEMNEVTIEATVEATSDWTDYFAGSASDLSEAFNAAAANATYVGLSFGGGFFFANGVGMETGTATFHLTDFEIE